MPTPSIMFASDETSMFELELVQSHVVEHMIVYYW
jgi:hypothetical protein